MRKSKSRIKMVKVPEAALISLVASKLKGRTLFPEKVEAAKKYLDKAKIKTANLIPIFFIFPEV